MTTEATTTITLTGVWVEYWTDREYDSPSADAEYRAIDAKIKAGLRTRGRGRTTTIELTHEELVILEEVAEIMVIVAEQSEPGPERSRELRAAKTAHILILDRLGEWNRELAHAPVPVAETPAPAPAPAPVRVPSLATVRVFDARGHVDHDAVRTRFESYPLIESPEHAVAMLIASNAAGVAGATADTLAADVAAWLDAHGYASSPWVRQKPGRILADIVLTGMYRILAADAAELCAEFWRAVERKNAGAKIREASMQRRYDEYAEACHRARICVVSGCERFSPYHAQCGEHCVACDNGVEHEHAGEDLAHIIDNPPVWRRTP